MKRTPIHFPRMKVRGARNRAKTAARHTTSYVIPFAKAVQLGVGQVQFKPVTEPGPDVYRIEQKSTTDGWGRRVITPPPPPPRSTPAFSMEFKVEDTGGMRELFNLLTGTSEIDPMDDYDLSSAGK